jgi:hypothetical protein
VSRNERVNALLEANSVISRQYVEVGINAEPPPPLPRGRSTLEEELQD